jgi:hypothetical protein
MAFNGGRNFPNQETVAFLESICRGPGLELQAYYLRLTPATIQVAGINFRQVTLFPVEGELTRQCEVVDAIALF